METTTQALPATATPPHAPYAREGADVAAELGCDLTNGLGTGARRD